MAPWMSCRSSARWSRTAWSGGQTTLLVTPGTPCWKRCASSASSRLQQSGEAGIIRQRHAAYFLALAERAEAKQNTIERDAWLDRLEAEHGNLHSALEWALEQEDAEIALGLCGSLLPFWQFRYHSNLGRDWVRRALALGKDVSAPVMRKALYCAGTLAYVEGELAEAAVLFADALLRYQEADDPEMTGRVELALGRLTWNDDDLDAARKAEHGSIPRSCGSRAAATRSGWRTAFTMRDWLPSRTVTILGQKHACVTH